MSTTYRCTCGTCSIVATPTSFKLSSTKAIYCTIQNDLLKFWCEKCNKEIGFGFTDLPEEGLAKVNTFMDEYENTPGQYAPQAVVDIVRAIVEAHQVPKFVNHQIKEDDVHYYPVWIGFSYVNNNITRLVASPTKPESTDDFFKGPFGINILTKSNEEEPIKPTGKTTVYKKKVLKNRIAKLEEIREDSYAKAWDEHGEINKDESPSWNEQYSRFRFALLTTVGGILDYLMEKERENND